jgi:hypothetical protein
VAAFEALKAALSTRAIARFGGSRARPLADSGKSRSHQFDVTFGEALGLRLGASAYRRAAAAALQRRFESASPASWREPRRMYDVTVQGVAPKPALPFYDRGTWQQTVQPATRAGR